MGAFMGPRIWTESMEYVDPDKFSEKVLSDHFQDVI